VVFLNIPAAVKGIDQGGPAEELQRGSCTVPPFAP